MSWIRKVLGLKPNRDEFVEQVKSRLREIGVGNDFMYEPEDFVLQVKEADGSVTGSYFLSNAYNDYCTAPTSERQNVLVNYFSPQVEIPDLLDDARENVLPRIQPRAFFTEMTLHVKLGALTAGQVPEDNIDFVHTLLSTHLALGLVYDTPLTALHFGKKTLEGWQIEMDELVHIAADNLRSKTDRSFTEVAPGIYMPQFADTYDASRLLIRERVAECSVKGRCVALAANRDTLVITGEDDPQGQLAMINAAEQALKLPRAFPMIPLVFTDGTWQEMPLQPELETYNRFCYLRAVSLAEIYNTQKALLDQLHEVEKKDIFVGTYLATEEKKTGRVFSSCSWTQGVHSLLPETDRLAFVTLSGAKAHMECVVSFDVAKEVVGDMMKPTNCYPLRYEVLDFPTSQMLDELKRLALDK